MKLIIGFMFALYSVVSFGADSKIFFDEKGEWKKNTLEELKKIPNVVFKSTESNVCYSSESGSVWNKIVDNLKDEDKDNFYENEEKCMADEGLRDNNKKLDNSQLNEKVASDKKADQETQYAGLNWGAGLMFANYSKELVLDATVENGTVRIIQKNRNRAIAVVESHYFFTPGAKKILGIGPFIGLGLAGDNGLSPLSLYGGGFMMGFRKLNSTSSWNVGLGYFVDTEAKLLKGNLVDGSATVETDSAKLFKKEDIGGAMLMFSASF